MQTRPARVVDLDDQSITVTVSAESACPRCAAGKGCGAGLLGSSRGDTRLQLPRPSGRRILIGDAVEISLQSERLLWASMLAYGLPLVLLVAALLVLRLLAPSASETTQVLTAATVVGASVAGARHYLRNQQCMQRLTPCLSIEQAGEATE